MTSDTRDRKRSRSPHRERTGRDTKRHCSRSPGRRRHHHRHRRHHHATETPAVRLPFRQSSLHKRGLEEHQNLLADYLDLQKQLDVTTLSEEEVKGRWKSFVGKWNRGELAEGWYDPETKQRADARAKDMPPSAGPDSMAIARQPPAPKKQALEQQANDEDDDDNDGYGPALPSGKTSGPQIPSLQDLQQRQELSAEDREAYSEDLRYERKTDRRTQKERLEELVPRADPGSRERQLEKKRDTAATNRSFADAKDSGTAEVAESDLMGEGGVDEYKAQLKANEKRKNEREIRKEEVLRARAAERDEKLAEHRRKEDKTMDMLKALAQQRYGAGNG